MSAEKARTIIGLDLHSVKVQLYVSHWQNGHEIPKTGQSILTTCQDLYATYQNKIPKESTTVIEASTGTFAVARKLAALGYGVKVVKADTVTHFERKDHINDAIDAKNLAEAEGIGYIDRKKKVVYIPSELYQDYRALERLYQNATSVCAMHSNHLWGLCSTYNVDLPPRSKTKKISHIRAIIEKTSLSRTRKAILETELSTYEKACEHCEQLKKEILEIVLHNDMMMKVQQIIGIGPIAAFSLIAHVEDITRFKTAKQLVSYIGLNPHMNESANSKGLKRLSRFGIRRVKSLFIEGAHIALSNGTDGMHTWARRKIMQGKHKNVVSCALARKMLVYAWHILKGHPIPNRYCEKSYDLKLQRLTSALGRKRENEEAYRSRQVRCIAIKEELFANVPPLTEEQMNASQKRKEKARRQRVAMKKPTKKIVG